MSYNDETYEQIKTRMKNNADREIDDRETSLFDASLSPFAIEISRVYISLEDVIKESSVFTATGYNLDKKVAERGIIRKPATKAIKNGYFNLAIEEGTEFSTIGLDNVLIYTTIEASEPYTKYYYDELNYTSGLEEELTIIGYYYATDTHKWYKDGVEITVEEVEELPPIDETTINNLYEMYGNLYIAKKQDLYKNKMECKTAGVSGNNYVGNILPMTNINNLTYAMIDEVVEEGLDTENDLSLRVRYLASLQNDNFGGNISSYRSYALQIDGVGAVQVYPHYKGAGTVKLSIINTNYNIASQELIDRVQNIICPPEEDGNQPSKKGYGIAVIGAQVDVGTATELLINVEFNVSLIQGATVETIRQRVINIVNEFLYLIRTEWGKALETNKINYIVGIYRARLLAELLKIEEILNITDLKLNDEEEDIICIEESDYTVEPAVDIQQLPFTGTITINQV